MLIATRRICAVANVSLRCCGTPLRAPLFRALPTRVNARLASSAIKDPRLKEFGRLIEQDYAAIKEKYDTPQHPIVLAHGLLGFDEVRLVGHLFPGIHYWRGIREAMAVNGIETIIGRVPPSSSIEERAEKLRDQIERKAGGKDVNIIAHSMGGLDARYMISRLRPLKFKVLSLTTIATPHRGSAFADWCFHRIPPDSIPRIYSTMEYIGLGTGAFKQLTREYMTKEFNPQTPDVEGVRYFSYGACFKAPWWSAFRQPNRIIYKQEGLNDGLVSVESSRWGEYKGTLIGTSHLDLINWTNRLRSLIWYIMGQTKTFNAIALYLDIADMLAKEGL